MKCARGGFSWEPSCAFLFVEDGILLSTIEEIYVTKTDTRYDSRMEARARDDIFYKMAGEGFAEEPAPVELATAAIQELGMPSG
jgi:hypothetical protein